MHAIGLGFLVLAACEKKEAAPAQPEPSATALATGTATATPTASATTIATASATTTATATAIASAKPTASASAKAGAALKASSAHLDGKNFAIDVASPGCRADTPCAMTIKLAATGEYHINDQYPYKLVPTAGFAPDGQDFKKDAEKTGTLTVRFTPKAPGEMTASGTFKLSVCSAENCQIEQQPVTLAVAVQ